MADKVDAVEIARTANGRTDVMSHLRRVGAGSLLCGIRILPHEAIGESRIWYAVAHDEADRFQACPTCDAQSGSYRVVSRPMTSIRPRTETELSPVDSMGDVIALYGALYRAIEGSLSGKSVVGHSVLVDVYGLAWQISFQTNGNGLIHPDSLSAIDARKALDLIAEYAMAIRYDLYPYVPAAVRYEDQAVTMLRARTDEIARQAQTIIRLCDGDMPDDDDKVWLDIKDAAASILGFANVPTGPETDETTQTT
jgi:hypothetical protein